MHKQWDICTRIALVVSNNWAYFWPICV